MHTSEIEEEQSFLKLTASPSNPDFILIFFGFSIKSSINVFSELMSDFFLADIPITEFQVFSEVFQKFISIPFFFAISQRFTQNIALFPHFSKIIQKASPILLSRLVPSPIIIVVERQTDSCESF